jgi:hypothetical protein
MTSTLKELTTAEITQIIYTAWRELALVTDEVTAWEPFDSLDNTLKALEMAQIEAIIDNPALRPFQLHEQFKVTGQEMIKAVAQNENIIARLNAYMIPFRALSLAMKTKFRLQVQLGRVLSRHNKNVKRNQKRQRKRQAISDRSVAKD